MGKPLCKRKDGTYYAKVAIKKEVFAVGDTVEICVQSENQVREEND